MLIILLQSLISFFPSVLITHLFLFIFYFFKAKNYYHLLNLVFSFHFTIIALFWYLAYFVLSFLPSVNAVSGVLTALTKLTIQFLLFLLLSNTCFFLWYFSAQKTTDWQPWKWKSHLYVYRTWASWSSKRFLSRYPSFPGKATDKVFSPSSLF